MSECEAKGHIVAMGGGGFSMEPENPLLDDFVMSLTGKDKPKVCFVPTASGDAERYVDRFEFCFRDNRCEPAVLRLFKREIEDLRSFLLAQDVIYVGGGNTANMLAVWRVHGVDAILREAWERGAVLCGVSAGAICWFEACVTDSFGRLAPLHDGLGLLSGAACPHYDGEDQRKPTLHRLIADAFPDCLALDDGAAAHFHGSRLIEVVTSRPKARAMVVRHKDAGVREEPLTVRYLRDRPV